MFRRHVALLIKVSFCYASASALSCEVCKVLYIISRFGVCKYLHVTCFMCFTASESLQIEFTVCHIAYNYLNATNKHFWH